MNRSPETTRDIDKRAELGEDFDFFDTDHDGRMQFDEFANFLSGIESGMSQDDAASALLVSPGDIDAQGRQVEQAALWAAVLTR